VSAFEDLARTMADRVPRGDDVRAYVDEHAPLLDDGARVRLTAWIEAKHSACDPLAAQDDPHGTIVACVQPDTCWPTLGVVVLGWGTGAGDDVWGVRLLDSAPDDELAEIPAGDCLVIDRDRLLQVAALAAEVGA
jgi:hypothetical protein